MGQRDRDGTALHRYRCYGLTLESTLDLPELSPAPTSDSGSADITIRRANLPETDDLTPIGPFSSAAPGTLTLTIPDIARFAIREGTEILFDPAPGIDEDSIRVFLLGSALGAALMQRGRLVLHGNAFSQGERCAICVGQSGAGKSTLAAALMQRGYRILADDVCPLDQEGRALSGMPRLKLWKDSAARLGIPTEGLARIRPHMDKFNLPLTDAFQPDPVPVAALYVLATTHEGEAVGIEDVSGIRKFQTLRRNSYRFHYLSGMALGPHHLRQCSDLGAKVPIRKITRQRTGFDVDGLADTILEDLEQQGITL